jgi:hypothetical protein
MGSYLTHSWYRWWVVIRLVSVALWGYVLNAKVLQRTYQRANLYLKLFEADASFPPPVPPWANTVIGQTYIYSEEYGIIRSRMVGVPTFDEGLCWDLILR